jgi:hypothetical protein
LLTNFIEGNVEGTRKWGGKRKQLLDVVKEKKRYGDFNEEALDHSPWRIRFGRGY